MPGLTRTLGMHWLAAWILVTATLISVARVNAGESHGSTASSAAIDATELAAYTPQAVLGSWSHEQWLTTDAPPTPALDYVVGQANQYQLRRGARIFDNLQSAMRALQSDILEGKFNVSQGKKRVHIGLAVGDHVGLVFVPAMDIPVSFWGMGSKPTDTRIHFSISASMTGQAYARLVTSTAGDLSPHPDLAQHTQACAKREQIGTSCAAVVWVRANGTQWHNLSIQNTHRAEPAQSGQQAVALEIDGADQTILDRVHVLGHQDTLYLRASQAQPSRSLIVRSLIAGDIDFIFGSGTAYIWKSEIRWIGDQRGLQSGYIAAPSTHINQRHGFVFDDCNFTSSNSGASPPAGDVYLARQWFAGATCSPYGDHAAACKIQNTAGGTATNTVNVSSIEAVGKMVVLRSKIGDHIDPKKPWAPWQFSRSHRAYRPIQLNEAVFWNNLAQSDPDPASLGHTKSIDDKRFLGESLNTWGVPRMPHSSTP